MDRRDTVAAGAGRARRKPTARHATWLRARSGDIIAMPRVCRTPVDDRARSRDLCQARRVLPAFSGLTWSEGAFVYSATALAAVFSLASSPLLYVLRLAAPCAL